MELTIKVDDKEGPFVIELLRKFPFVQEIKHSRQTAAAKRVEELWREKAQKLFTSEADFEQWLAAPNPAVQQQSPISLLNDEEGYQTVSKLLGRLEHGVMA